MTTIFYQGTAAHFEWRDNQSWTSFNVPISTDDVVLNSAATVANPCRIVAGDNWTINSVELSRGNGLTMTGASILHVTDTMFVGGVSGTSFLSITGFSSMSASNLRIGAGGSTAGAGRVIVDAGSVTVIGTAAVGFDAAGTLTLRNGGSLNAGAVTVGDLFHSADGTLVIGGDAGQAAANGGSVTSSGIAMLTIGSQVLFNAFTNTGISAAITGVGSVKMDGSGDVSFSGANTYSGTTTINAGTLIAAAANAFSAGSAVVLNSGGSINLAGFSQSIGSLSGSGQITNSGGAAAAAVLTQVNASDSVFSGSITDGDHALGFVKGGAGAFAMIGNNNTYTGTTTVAEGKLLLGGGGSADGSIGTGSLIVNSGATFQLFKTGNYTFSNKISGSGVFLKSLGNTVTLGDDTSDFTGQFNIAGGTLKAAGTGVFGVGAAIDISAGATLELDGFNQSIGGLTGSGVVNNVDVNFSVILTVANAADNTFDGTITNAGAAVNLVKDGAAGLYLVGANTYTGTTAVNAGTLIMGGGGATGSIGAGNLTINAAGTFDFFRSDDVSFGNKISGDGALRKFSANTVTLTNAANDHTGLTYIAEGTLKGGAANVFGTNSAVDIASGAALNLGGFDQSIGALSGEGNIINSGRPSQLTQNNATATLFSGVISGDVSFTKIGAGTLTFDHAQTYIDETTVGEGTLALVGAGSITSSITVIVNAGTILDLSGITSASTSMQGLALFGSAEIRLGGKTLVVTRASGDAGSGGFIAGSGFFADAIQFNVVITDFSLANLSFSSWNNFVDKITINGNAQANSLTGSAQADILNGGIDNVADTLTGGFGDDTYIINTSSDNIVEAVGGGTADRARASVSFVLGVGDNIEFLETANAAGNANLNLTGNEFAQSITGNAGNNVLTGGGNADTMIGLGGNDSYGVDNALDQVIEAVGGGTDRVYASVSYVLAAGQEIETLSTNNNAGITAINLTGNAFNNALIGNLGANVLNGGGGIDAMTGLGGSDSYAVDNALDTVIEAVGGGIDRVYASVNYTLAVGQEIETLSTSSNAGTAAIRLTGNNFANTLIGNAGANLLLGGLGNDTLTGLNGADTFVFNTALNSATNHDTITDFNVAADTIQLENAIFTALTATGTLAAGLFKDLSLAAQDANDVILYNRPAGNLFIDTNGLAAGGVVLFADVTDGTALTFADFVVI